MKKLAIIFSVAIGATFGLASCKKDEITPNPTTPTPVGNKLEIFYELQPTNLADTANMGVSVDAGYYNADSVGVNENLDQYGQGHGKFVFNDITDKVDASFYIVSDGSELNSTHILISEVRLNGNPVLTHTSTPAVANGHLFIVTTDMW